MCANCMWCLGGRQHLESDVSFSLAPSYMGPVNHSKHLLCPLPNRGGDTLQVAALRFRQQNLSRKAPFSVQCTFLNFLPSCLLYCSICTVFKSNGWALATQGMLWRLFLEIKSMLDPSSYTLQKATLYLHVENH